jgi:hypothetical protein
MVLGRLARRALLVAVVAVPMAAGSAFVVGASADPQVGQSSSPTQVGQGLGPAGPTQTASGSFTFTTANGILPTWASAGLVISAVDPGRAITMGGSTSATVTLPIVAKTGTANAAAGGFRITNTETAKTIRCSSPTIETTARVVDCVLNDGSNARLFAIGGIDETRITTGVFTRTTVFEGMQIRVNGTAMADLLNDELSTNVFSPSVTFARGNMDVTRAR